MAIITWLWCSLRVVLMRVPADADRRQWSGWNVRGGRHISWDTLGWGESGRFIWWKGGSGSDWSLYPRITPGGHISSKPYPWLLQQLDCVMDAPFNYLVGGGGGGWAGGYIFTSSWKHFLFCELQTNFTQSFVEERQYQILFFTYLSWIPSTIYFSVGPAYWLMSVSSQKETSVLQTL